MSGRSDAGGFTLVEVLASLVITAVIVLATYGVVSGTMRARKKVEDHMGAAKEGAAILSLLAEDMGATVRREETDCFVVGEGTFDFVSVAWNPATGLREFAEVGYAIEKEGDLFRLFRRFSDVGDDPAGGGTYTLVSDNVVSWRAMFFDGEEWKEDWEQIRSLPVAVRIEFELAMPGGDPMRFGRLMALPCSDLVGPAKLDAGGGPVPAQEETS